MKELNIRHAEPCRALAAVARRTSVGVEWRARTSAARLPRNMIDMIEAGRTAVLPYGAKSKWAHPLPDEYLPMELMGSAMIKCSKCGKTAFLELEEGVQALGDPKQPRELFFG